MFLDFLLTYWKEIVYGSVALLTILITLFKRNGKVNPVVASIYKLIPGFIRSVESIYGAGNGNQKKTMVMDLISRSYEKLTGYKLINNSVIYKDFSQFVENVLNTPERKDNL